MIINSSTRYHSMNCNNMKIHKVSWVILFGGAGREQNIFSMIAEGINVSLVLVPRKRSEKLNHSVVAIRKRGILVRETGKRELSTELDGLKNHGLLSIGFPYLIPKRIYSKHPVALNIHPTLLPKYRGPTSGAYILINGDTLSGSTVHLIDEEVDAGAIVSQSKVELSPFDTLRSMQRKVYDSEPSLIARAIHNLEQGLDLETQDETNASIYSQIRTPSDSEIDPTKPLLELINEIRACDVDYFPAFFIYEGHKLNIKLWREDKGGDHKESL